ncbi:Hsp20/alpha crystallin family protein [Brevundimonas sp.]|uniref:Hsp20/alpha crystallin family protein n=1 Tax=Brevundimonas sp. TaxID=1871086 RepID=UPI0019AAFEB8|nr:Hsp20/alpha crystallin family protein [Brevundimonas sp.]MBD3836154.1 Hsp20 family protein [Brevundimonas sp.]
MRTPFNVSQTVEAVTVEFDVPGHSKEGLILEVGPQRLRLQALSRQRRSGDIAAPFDCSVDLPDAVDADQVKATLENGVLVVEMTKVAWTRGDAKRVPVREASVPVQTAQEGDQAGAPKE